jgi:hypothetical protein
VEYNKLQIGYVPVAGIALEKAFLSKETRIRNSAFNANSIFWRICFHTNIYYIYK